MSQYLSHGIFKLFNNINSFNSVFNFNFTVADDRSDILAWLSPLEPRLRHKDIQESRVKGVGEWVLQTKEFRNWYASSGGSGSDNAVLFCYGDPGVGKTFISSLVVDSLCDWTRGQDVAVACFYFDFAARKEQSQSSMLGALLKQVVSGLEKVPKEIAQAHKDHKKAIGGRLPQLPDILKMLQTASSQEPTFICIDALDECMDEYLVDTLDLLSQVLQRSPGTRMFVTGRPYIQDKVMACFSGRVSTLLITPPRHDITSYLRDRLGKETKRGAMTNTLKEDLLKKIPESISEIFMLAPLSVDAILQETKNTRRRRKLHEISDGLGLGGAYGGTLSRIDGQGQGELGPGMAALMWISHSERPLKINELCHALAVEIGSPDIDVDDVPLIQTLLACCQGLVAIDKKASTVRLIHVTLQKYLHTYPRLASTAHSTIAETCLSYLNSHLVRALSTNSPPDPQGTPFLEYSSLYWGIHARRDLSDCAKQLALDLFQDYSNHISTKILLNSEKSRFHTVDFDIPSFFSSLHCASFFGIVGIVTTLVEGCDINQTDCTGSTPLVWASLNGHEEVVGVLLKRGDVNPKKPDEYVQTSLWYAAMNGHQGVVKILLNQKGISPDKPDTDGRTPLWWAAFHGHERVVGELLRRHDVDPHKPDTYGQTPLQCASGDGHAGVAALLQSSAPAALPTT